MPETFIRLKLNRTRLTKYDQKLTKTFITGQSLRLKLKIADKINNSWSSVDYLWIFVMFLLAIRTLILMGPIHCRGSNGVSDLMLHFSKPLQFKKQKYLYLGWSEGE